MKLEVTVDGERRSVEVDLDRGVLHWEGKEIPARVVQDSFAKVELEIGGEKFVVEGWPPGNPDPPAPLVVNGERFLAGVERRRPASSTSGASIPPLAPPAPKVPAPAARDGTEVVPPMPGRIVELRVAQGDHVAKGQVLLVLEAMKMRNEVVAPFAGTVISLPVAAGSNVRSRETLLRLRPDP